MLQVVLTLLFLGVVGESTRERHDPLATDGLVEFHLSPDDDGGYLESDDVIGFLLEVRNNSGSTVFVPENLGHFTGCGSIEFHDSDGEVIEWACSTPDYYAPDGGCWTHEPDHYPRRPVFPHASSFFWIDVDVRGLELGVGTCSAVFRYITAGGRPEGCSPVSPTGLLYGPVRSERVDFEVRNSTAEQPRKFPTLPLRK